MESVLKILVVDDDAIDRMAVRRALQRAGIELAAFVEAETCAGAIAQLEQDHFDCAIVDYRLPDGDGLTLVRQVRDRGFPVALIVITGQGDERVAVELMKAGANDYLSKSSLNPEVVSRSVQQAVRLNRAELTAQLATQQLRESEERYRLVLEGSNDGIWDWYICDNEVFCNDRMYEILGLSQAEIGTAQNAFVRLIHPEDQGRVLASMRSHLNQGTPFDVEFRMRHSSGTYRYCTSRGKAQRDQYNRLFRMSGIVSDITQRKDDEQRIVELNRDLENRVNELQTLLNVIPVGIAIAEDANCNVVKVNANLSSLLNLDRTQNASNNPPNNERLPYKIYRHNQELALHALPMQKAAATGTPISGMELDVRLNDSRRVKLLAEIAPLFNENGQPRGCIGAFLDITDRHRTETAQRFLANASALLATTLDAETILESLAPLTVHDLGDVCLIHTQADGRLTLATSYPISAARRLSGMDSLTEEIRDVVISGRSKLFLTVTEPGLLQQIGYRSLLIVPMLARDKILGAMTFAADDRVYTSQDLDLATDLARRAGFAIDHAQLYQATQRAEQNLRRAILVLGEQQQQLRTLQRLADLLNQRLTNLSELLQLMIDAICETISNAGFGLILLYNSQADTLELTATTQSGWGVDAPENNVTAPLEATLTEVFRSGESILIQGNRGNAALMPASLCAVAIESSEGGRQGVLAVGNWLDPSAFDDDDVQLLMAFSEQAAIALNNAQLINALEEREAQLAKQNATLVQQNQELENQRQQIQLQNLKLTEAAQLKTQFLATISHELRTPMNAIMGFSQLLLRQKTLTPAQIEMATRILNNSKNLLALINDILDLSKIEAGRLELRLERFNIASLLLTTIDELRSLAEPKRLTLRSDFQLFNQWVINDSSRVRQIFVNLLSNAIKFTDSGSVEVFVEEIDPDRIAISVKDTGVGIGPKDIKHIFEEFRQIDQTITRRHAGTGLGLAITKWLVELMHGSISVESELGVGSTFRVELPREVSNDQNVE